MLQLKKIIKEGRTNSISKELAFDALNKKIQIFDGLENIPEIYRGKEDSTDYGFIRPSKFTRKSAHTENYYTLIIDNSDKWSNFPKRSKSIVCSTSESKAADYTGFKGGDPLRAFPEEGSKIGVCPDGDIFYSFEKLHKRGFRHLREFNNTLHSLYQFTIYPKDDELSESWPKLKNELNEIGESNRFLDVYEGKYDFDKEPPKLPQRQIELIEKLAFDFFPNYNTFYEMIDNLLDPSENGFKVKTFKKGLSLEFNREVWTNGNSLLVDINKVSKLLNQHENY